MTAHRRVARGCGRWRRRWAAGRGETYSLGIGMPGSAGELADDPVVLGHLLLGDRDGAGRLDGELVAEPVGAADEHEADDEADEGAAAAANAPPTTMKRPPRPASRTSVLIVFLLIAVGSTLPRVNVRPCLGEFTAISQS